MKMYFSKIKITALALSIFFFIQSSSAQNINDSTITLKEVEVTSIYPSKISLLRSPVSMAVIKSEDLEKQNYTSFLPALNSVSGVRMEERSPGSYRLSIRGSLLRSPFGIRNIKIYMDEFPLTDAGGNTYLNLIDPSCIKAIELVKGPEGSVFGANTGGVILIRTRLETDSATLTARTTAGSFGAYKEYSSFNKKIKKYSFNFTEAYQHCDGYRENSAFKRAYLQTTQQWNYTAKNSIRLLAFYSDLSYKTPGGLTLDQFDRDPKMARPASGIFKGATEQQAGVYNQTLYGGISHEIFLFRNFKNVTILSSSNTNFENPFITNYEFRKETTTDIRSYFELTDEVNSAIRWKWNIGGEYQMTKSNFKNYGNNLGKKTTELSLDDIDVRQDYLFTQLFADIGSRVIAEAALSLNDYQYHYKNTYPFNESAFNTKQFAPQLMPRLSLSYRIINNLVWRISASKGYSPPTIAEIRPSDNHIYSDLQPEFGWNYESGLRFMNDHFEADLAAFDFRLQNTIVRRTNDNGTDYFINAGNTKQEGIEFQLAAKTNYSKDLSMRLTSGVSYYHFNFMNYTVGANDYSNHKISGVPDYTAVTGLYTQLPAAFYLYLQHSYTDKIPLNDATTFFAGSYNVFELKGGWGYLIKKVKVDAYAGASNLTNTKYSLGNDINASGGRYYNAAPERNYFVGINITF